MSYTYSQAMLSFVVKLFAVAMLAMTAAATAETASPQAFLDGIYKPYLAKDSKGTSLASDAEIRRYFASPLADAIIKDFAAAHKVNEVPMLNGAPFIDAQDWEISNLKIAVKSTALDLVNTPAGWRIAEIRGPSGSLRELYKLK